MGVMCGCGISESCPDWIDEWDTESGEIPSNIPCPPPCPRKYIIDPINVFNAKGRLIGYSWRYNDTVTLKAYFDESVLSIYTGYEDEFAAFLSGKKFDFVFTDMRGNDIYTLTAAEDDIVLDEPYRIELPLNTDESNLIEKNTYSLSVVMRDPENESQISIFKDPYLIYVK